LLIVKRPLETCFSYWATKAKIFYFILFT
jgi:hypothetical protein